MRSFKRRRGVALYLMVASLVTVSGMAALVVDISSALLSRTRQQAAADAAAMAACYDLMPPANESKATSDALTWAQKNGYTLSAKDVSFWTRPDGKTAVTVACHQAVPTTFARILGINAIDVAVNSSAVPGAVTTIPPGLIPIGLVSEPPGSGGCGGGSTPWEVQSSDGSGSMVPAQVGTPVMLKAGAGGSNRGNFAALALGGNGASVYRSNIAQGYAGQIAVNQWVTTEPGNMVGPTQQGFGARQQADTADDEAWRHVYVPLIDEQDWDNLHGRGQVRVRGFASVRIDQINGGEVDATLISMPVAERGSLTDAGVTPTDFSPVLIPTPQT
ncbi:MAG TPA: pilus assembly protein TadG-related protein [Oscillatoriaceae cyanobacterium]